MPTIAKLVVRLSLNDSQYQKGIDGAIKQAKAAEQKINQATDSVKKTTQNRFGSIGQTFNKIGQSFASSKLIAGIRDFGSKLTSSLPQIGKFTSALGSGLGKAAGIAKGAFSAISAGAVAAGAAVGIAATAVVGLGIAVGAGALKLAQAAAPIQGVQAAFSGLASSFEGGSQAMLASLQKASNGMVTNAELMRQYNTAAQLVSTDFANQLPAAMESVGKVAASTGQDIGFLMNSLTVGVGRLSAPILDNLAIQVDLNQAYQDFADKNGLVASSLTKTQQQMALMDQVTQKLAENTANIPPVFGSASQVFGAFKTDLQNIKDQMGMDLLPTFTQLFMGVRQFMPLLSSFGKLFSGTFAGLVNVAKGFGRGIAKSLGIDMENLGGNMEAWGSNIVTQLARGMAKAIGAVISVLNQLGQVIAGWLAPGSPPKLLPDLPAWGESAANWFLKGFTNANVSILRDLSGQVESFIRSSMAGKDSDVIAKAVLGARGGLESAIASGGNIMSAIPQQVQGYAKALIASQQAAQKLEKAQNALNSVTKEYDDKLKPISDRLKAIQVERDKYVQDQRKQELQAIIADPTANADAVRFANLELEEMALQDQQAALEENKDAAVSAAQEKVDAAQAEMDAAEKRLQLEQELLQHQIETNNLMADTISQVNGLAAAIGAGGAGAVGAMESLEDVMSNIGSATAPALSSSMSELAESIMSEFDGVALEAEALGETWGQVAEGITQKWQEAIDWWQTNFGEGGVWPGIMAMATDIFNTQWGPGGTWEGNIELMKTAGQLLVDWWNENWGEGGTWAGIMDMATGIIKSQWGEGGTWPGIFDLMKTAGGQLMDKYLDIMQQIGDAILHPLDTVNRLYDAVKRFYDWLKDKVFDFSINLPLLPSWATPGSPIPLHTAFENFDRFLKTADFDIDMAVNGISGVGNAMLDRTALATAGSNNSYPFNMYGSVNNGMNEQELKAKVQGWIREENRRR